MPLAEAPEVASSPAGSADGEPVRMPPGLPLNRLLQTLRFGWRPAAFTLQAQRELGEVFRVKLLSRDDAFVVTTHPDHVKSLFTAPYDDVPSLTADSPLRPFLGSNSVLTLNGDAHMRARKVLLPPFHGDAVRRYTRIIETAISREIDT